MTAILPAHDFDPARLLQPASEIAQTGQALAPVTGQWVKRHAPRILELGPVQLYELLTPIICTKYCREALQSLHETGLLAHVLPELEATVSFSQEAGRRHKDVWEHTKTVVWQAVPRPLIRWAALLHDIGKVPTREMLPDGRVTFHGHAEVGRRMFKRTVARRIAFPAEIQQRLSLLILHHLRAGQYEPTWTDAAVRRFAKDMGDLLDDLLLLSRADVTSRRAGKRRGCLRQITELAHRIRRLQEEDSKVKPLPPGLGNLLMQQLELPPGPHIGEMRRRLESAYEAGELLGGQDAGYYLDRVHELGLLDGITIVVPRRLTAAADSAPSESLGAPAGQVDQP